MHFDAINPSTEEKITSYPVMSGKEVFSLIDKSEESFQQWRNVSFSERAACLKKAAEILRKNKSNYAGLMAVEMGKPLAQGESESDKCAWVCDYYAENAENFLKNDYIKTEARESFVKFAPLGSILAIMPWNFPYWQVFRFAAPALMAGNTVILKHAPNVTGCALEIEKILHEAGIPKDAFRTIISDIDLIPEIMANPIIKAVTLTGSTAAGRSVASLAGKYLKKSVLELGGSDPYLILEDADLEAAAETCVFSRLINSGQSCIAAKRFIVVDAVKKEFEEIFSEKMRTKTMGNPLLGNYNLGPMARRDLQENLHSQVEKSINQGAKLLLGGKIPEGKGYFYPPTILTDVKQGVSVFTEETFGPVASIIPVRDQAEAIKVANDSVYGLGAAVFTKDDEKGKYIAENELQAGACFVNSFVMSDPRLPFGGIKESGFGRELSYFGIHEFVNIKTVYVK